MEISGAKDGRRTEEGWTKGTFPSESPLSLCYLSSRFCVVSSPFCAIDRPESWAGAVHVFASGSLPGQDGVSAWNGRPEVRVDPFIVLLLTSCSQIENALFFAYHLFVSSLGYVSKVRHRDRRRVTRLKEDVEIEEQLYPSHSTPSFWITEQVYFRSKVFGFLIGR